MDLVQEMEAYAFSQHNKGNFLYSAAIAQSTIDYSPKAVKNGVVDSLLSRAVILVAVNFPSYVRDKGTEESSKSKCRGTNGAQHHLYLGLSPPLNNTLHKLGLLYHLHSSSFQLLLPSLKF